MKYPDGILIKDWKDIPVEILLRILSFVNDDRMIIVAIGVCHGWKLSLSLGLTCLNLSSCNKNLNNLVLSLSSKFIKLKVLDLQQSTIPPQLEDDAIEMISAHCNDIQELDLSKSLKLTDASLYSLAHGCPNLSTLNINGCKSMSENAVSYLPRFCKKLKNLNLERCIKAATDVSLTAIATNCSNLQSIDLRWCENVSDEGIICLANGCPNLKNIDLSGCNRLSDESLIALAYYCKDLKWMSLHYCQNITDKAMYGLAKSQLVKNQNKLKNVKNNYGEGLIYLDISLCTALNPLAVQAVCDSFPGLHTCPRRQSLIITGCLRLSSVHCDCSGSHGFDYKKAR